MTLLSLSPQELNERILEGECFSYLDVRTPEECQQAPFTYPVHHVPLGCLEDNMSTLDRNQKWVVLCHHGVRSATACTMLIEQGLSHVYNLRGGIDLWAREIDGNIPFY